MSRVPLRQQLARGLAEQGAREPPLEAHEPKVTSGDSASQLFWRAHRGGGSSRRSRQRLIAAQRQPPPFGCLFHFQKVSLERTAGPPPSLPPEVPLPTNHGSHGARRPKAPACARPVRQHCCCAPPLRARGLRLSLRLSRGLLACESQLPAVHRLHQHLQCKQYMVTVFKVFSAWSYFKVTTTNNTSTLSM